MAEAREVSKWGFLVSPRWVAWHVFVVAAVAGMLALGDWQFHRAVSGNGLSWAYTFEWPIFAVFALVFWIKTIRDEVHPPAQAAPLPEDAGPAAAGGAPGPGGAGGGADEADPELAAYNAYLARLTREVKGHGRWHGLR